MTRTPSPDSDASAAQDAAPAEILRKLRRATAAEAGGTWPAKAELAELLRRILDELPHSRASKASLRELVAPLARVAETLESEGATERNPEALIAGMADFPHVSPVSGFANPIASPFDFSIDPEKRVAVGRGRFRRVHEGGPGIVHGGLLAAAVDELLGMATTFAGSPGMTGSLTMHYLKPTPIETPLVIEARFDGSEGRRLTLSADVWAGDVRTAHATALFVSVGAEMFSKLDAHRRARSDEG